MLSLEMIVGVMLCAFGSLLSVAGLLLVRKATEIKMQAKDGWLSGSYQGWKPGSYDEWVGVSGVGEVGGEAKINNHGPALRARKDLEFPPEVIEFLLLPLEPNANRKISIDSIGKFSVKSYKAMNQRRLQLLRTHGEVADA